MMGYVMKKKNVKLKKVKEHLKDDMRIFDKEKAEDKKLLKSLRKSNGKKKKSR